MLRPLLEYNRYLYEVMSYERMNTATIQKRLAPGSNEEAAYCYAILQKVTNALEYLPTFMVKEKNKEEASV